MACVMEMASYQENLGTLEIPEDDLLTADLSISPATYVRQAGRPRKRRIRSHGESNMPINSIGQIVDQHIFISNIDWWGILRSAVSKPSSGICSVPRFSWSEAVSMAHALNVTVNQEWLHSVILPALVYLVFKT
ncbi:mutatorlike transposase [Plasmopara halstedii]|uniref:Mutatorlike transposase n=1 Tax=Plasmopara halstedii TaxID=4781 RepID=A0A0P1AS88_PLAHL|nr:mutatorlike transposase [Plasmopara halstedii]CEG44525.1 mutatorlike transposase [Plasmopara halstedii]|eukprot:XP_024580894.1 mutatorlike transposase [Plasmopara halstedii]